MNKTTLEREADVEVLFEFNGTKTFPVCDGYRPHHVITDGIQTTGVHHYENAQTVPADGTAKGTITFITPEAYPHCLWEGKKINIQEGSLIVGRATILKVLNPLLLDESKAQTQTRAMNT